MAKRRQPGVLKSVQAAARGIVIQITGDGESAKRALVMVQDELKRTAEQAERTKAAANFNTAFNVARQTLAIAGLTLSVGALGAAVRSVVVDSLALGETLVKASAKTGLYVGTLSTLHYIAAITNGDFDGMTAAVSKMDKTIGSAVTGNKQAAATMAELGLNAKDLASRSDGAEIGFKTLTARIAATENPLVRVKLATDALGKSGAQQIPMLIDIGEHWDAWVAKAKEAGVYLDGQQAAALARANEHLNELKQRAEGAGLAFTEGLVPGLQSMFNVISHGKSDMEIFTEFGNLVGRGLNFATAGAYAFASGLAKVLEVYSAGKGDIVGAMDWSKVASADDKESQDAMFFAKTGMARGASESIREHKAAERPAHSTGAPDLVSSQAGKSDNPIAQAAAALAQEQAKAAADATRANYQTQLSDLDTQHKLLLTSDQDYYKQKFYIASQEYATERESLDAQTRRLQELLKKQQSDPLLKRDKSGSSAEELKTQRELLQLQERKQELDAKQQEARSRYQEEVGSSKNAAELAGLRAAAALERERNSGITAQIALIQREHELEAQKSTLAGGSSADAQAIKDSGALAVQKLQLAQIEESITQVERDHKRAVEDTNDAVEKGDINKRTAAQRTKVANAEELQDLQALADQYRTLAEAIGDPNLIEKSKDLDQQLASLGRDDRRGTFGKEVQEGLEGITTSIVDAAARGKQSFGEMAKSILEDLDKLALKMAEEKFVVPLFEQAFGGGKGSGKGASKTADASEGLGEAFGNVVAPASGIGGGGGPSIYKPDQKSGSGGFLNGAIGIFGKIASAAVGGQKGAAPNVNIHNHSSQPVDAGAPQYTFDSETKQAILDIYLQDQMSGGASSQL